MRYFLEERDGRAILEYRLSPEEKIDQDVLAMLSNNELSGVLGPELSQFNNNVTLLYDVSGLDIAADIFAGHIFYKEHVLSTMKSALAALMAAEEHLIDFSQLEINLRQIYLNDQLEVTLLCIPVAKREIGTTPRQFLRDLSRSIEKNADEDLSYVREIDSYLSNEKDFTLDGFGILLGSLSLSGESFPRGGEVCLRPLVPVAPLSEATVSSSGATFPQTFPLVGSSEAPHSSSQPEHLHQQSQFAGMAVPFAHMDSSIESLAVPWQQASGNQGSASALPGLLGSSDQKKDKKKRSRKEKKQKNRKADDTVEEKKGGFFGLLSKKDKEIILPKGPQVDYPVPDSVASYFDPGIASEIPPQPSEFNFRKAEEGSFDEYGELSANHSQDVSERGFGATVVKRKKSLISKSERASGDVFPDERVDQVLIPQEPTVRSAGTASVSEPIVQQLDIPHACVRQVSTDDIGWIDKPLYRLGRKRVEVDFYLPNDLSISRVHAIISYSNGDFFLADNDSDNHTYLNGRMLKKGDLMRLSDGDEFVLGEEKFRFFRS